MKGIYAISSPTGNISQAALDAKIEGIFFKYSWYDLQDDSGKCNFTTLYSRLKKVADSGKKILLSISCGSKSSAYLYPAVEKLHFTEYRREGKGDKFPLWIPDVINPVYIIKLNNFFEQLFTYLKSKPEIYSKIEGFKITGLNRDTDEIRLPWQTPELINKPDCTDATLIWQQHNYTEEYVLSMWKIIVDQFYLFNPDKYLNMALVVSQAFPCINEAGVYEYKSNENFTYKLSEYLISKTNKSALNSTALTETTGTPAMIQKSNAARKGYQENLQMYGTNHADELAYQNMLLNGYENKADWIEVSDLNIAAYKSALESMNEHLIS